MEFQQLVLSDCVNYLYWKSQGVSRIMDYLYSQLLFLVTSSREELCMIKEPCVPTLKSDATPTTSRLCLPRHNRFVGSVSKR